MTFSSTIEEVNSTRRKFKISVPAASIKVAVSEVASEIQKTAEVRGFRKGKAPQSIIRKFYFGDIVKKAADKVINSAYSDASKAVDFQIVSYPQIEPVNQFDENNDFEFSATVDINPKIDIKDYSDITIKMNQNLNIDLDSELEKVLSSYSRVFGKTEKDESGRALAKNDVANVSYCIFCEGSELKDKEAKNQLIELNGSNIPEIEEALIGLSANQNKVFSVTYPDNYKDQELKGKTVEFHLTLNSVETVVPAILDDAFAQRIGHQTIDDAKNSIKETLKKSNEEARTNVAFAQVVDHVLAKNEFEVAESLIENTIDRVIAEANSNATKDTKIKSDDESVREKYRELANKQVKGILALGHIARQENIAVSDDEMLREMAAYAMANRIDPQNLVKKAGKQVYDEFRGQVMIRKVIAKILETATIEYVNDKK